MTERLELADATLREWDAVVLDIMLPQMNGMEVLRRLRRDSQVPVIMLTARDALRRVIACDRDADATALSIGSLQLGIAVELLLDPTLDMGRMRLTARQAVSGMLGI